MHLAAAAPQRENSSMKLEADNYKRVLGSILPTPRWFGKMLQIADFYGIERIIKAEVRNQEILLQALKK